MDLCRLRAGGSLTQDWWSGRTVSLVSWVVQVAWFLAA